MPRDDLPPNINPLVHSGTVITRKPSRKGAGRPQQPPGAGAGASVRFDPAMIATIATYGNYSKNKASIHYALWRAAAAATVDGRPHGLAPEWMFDTMGSLASTLRHAEVDAPAIFHYALNRLQLTLFAIQRLEADPVKQRRDTRFRNLTLILAALEKQLARHLQDHPEYVLSHEQWIGMEPRPLHAKDALGTLGEKPEFRVARKRDSRRRARDGSESDSEPQGDN